jgi:hypothetical protein
MVPFAGSKNASCAILTWLSGTVYEGATHPKRALLFPFVPLTPLKDSGHLIKIAVRSFKRDFFRASGHFVDETPFWGMNA